MTADELKQRQAPLKSKYRDDPASALCTLRVAGTLDPARVACAIDTWGRRVEAGLHPAAGGDGTFACSADMLLEALVGCAGVTLLAVATALQVPIQGGTVIAEGDVDFRGTLGVSREVPVGFLAIRLTFTLDGDATPEQLESLKKLCERYCVVAQSLKTPLSVTVGLSQSSSGRSAAS